MSDAAKIDLSPDEAQLIGNSTWILTKRKIIDQVCDFFGVLSEKMRSIAGEATASLPEEAVLVPPKISKGENYLGLPYVILDYPRVFSPENVFAIRTMFWWGNFFSVTLQLAGAYKESYGAILKEKLDAGEAEGYFICVNTEQWEHHFEANNYIPVEQLDFTSIEATLTKNPFIKLAVKFPLSEWETAGERIETIFLKMLGLLAT